MPQSDRINTRIEPALKKKAARIFDSLGLNEAEAIRMFYAQVALHNGLPFAVKFPNAETLAAFAETDTPEKLPSHKTFRKLREDAGV